MTRAPLLIDTRRHGLANLSNVECSPAAAVFQRGDVKWRKFFFPRNSSKSSCEIMDNLQKKNLVADAFKGVTEAKKKKKVGLGDDDHNNNTHKADMDGIGVRDSIVVFPVTFLCTGIAPEWCNLRPNVAQQRKSEVVCTGGVRALCCVRRSVSPAPRWSPKWSMRSS